MPLQNTFRVNNIIPTLLFGAAAWMMLALAFAALPSLQTALGSAPFLTGGGPGPAGGAGVAPAAPADNQSVGASQSFNWSGYAAVGTFTGVSGSWSVPSDTSDLDIASEATWIGIGGVRSRDLIQAGTQATIDNGQVEYRAWYELLPDVMRYVPLAVRPGDTIAASINQVRQGQWQIVIANGTTGKTYQTTVAYDSSLSSAEWIEERPSLESGGLLPLSDFDAIKWSSAYAVESGRQVSASEAGAEPISMLTRSGTVIAKPSALAGDGASFTIARTNTPADIAASPQPDAAPYLVRIFFPQPDAQMPPDGSYTQTSTHTSVSSSGGHGSYYVWVDGRLVKHEEW